MWLQTAVKSLKVQISQSYIWAADAFYSKPATTDLFIFKRKIPKGNALLNKEVSSQSTGKEFLVLIKRKTVI